MYFIDIYIFEFKKFDLSLKNLVLYLRLCEHRFTISQPEGTVSNVILI